jgi:hypothetical protein
MFLALFSLTIAAFLAGAVLGILVLLIVGIRRADRFHLADAPTSHADAIARRILAGVRYPANNDEGEDP